MERRQVKASVAALFYVVVGLLALIIVRGNLRYTWRATISVPMADAWWFVDTFIHRYFDGSLGVLDFFAKRGSLDNAQPLQKILLLLNTVIFDMDFGVEGVFGVIFGILFVGFATWLVRVETRGQPYAGVASGLSLLGLAAIVFSLNDLGVFNWSLATLSLFYPLGVLALLICAEYCLRKRRPLLLATTFLAACLLLDTAAILVAAAVCALIVLRRTQAQGRVWDTKSLAAPLVAVAIYVVGYQLAFPGNRADMATMERIHSLFLHGTDAWKAFVIPFGSVVLAPSRIKSMYGAEGFWWCLAPAAILLWIGHVWFWREFLRHRQERVPFVAAGLMLFFYATIAGIVWGRVPRFDFNYLMQSRYLVFYELQLVAMLMLLATKAARTTHSITAMSAFAVAVATATFLAGYFLHGNKAVLRSEAMFNRHLADTIVDLANNPAHVPADCSANHLTICGWSQSARVEVLDLIRREKLNVFSPTFRTRHGLPPLAPDAGAASKSQSSGGNPSP